MPYDARLPLMFQYQAAKGDQRTLADVADAASRRRIAEQAAADASRAADTTDQFNQSTMGSRVAQEANQARQGGLQNTGLELGLPAKRLGAQQAGIESNILEQMFKMTPQQGPEEPPSTTNGLPYYIASQNAQRPRNALPPIMQNQYGSKSLAELRQMKAQAGPTGEFLGKFVDPLIAQKSNAEEVTPALTEIAAAAQLPGGTREQARAKGAALSAVLAKYPFIASDPRIKEAITTAMPRNTDFNPISLYNMQPPPESVIENAAKRIANKESTISQEINKGRFSGTVAMQMHDDLVNRVKQIDPNFSEAETEAGFAFGKNPSTRRAIAQLDNAYSTIDRLEGVYKNLDNGEFPTLNKAINAGKIQVGDIDAARASIAEVLGNDELTQAFSRGGMGSDKLREMSAALANYNLSPRQMAAQFDELKHGLERSRNAYVGQGGGYIRELKTDKGSKKVQASTHPQASAAEQWAHANPNDPRAAKILQRLGK